MPVAVVEISASALRHNAAALRALHPTAKAMAVVKANAYGHGLPEVVSVLESEVDKFFVDDLDELRSLRRCTGAPALVGGYVPADEVEEALALDAELVVYDEERLPAIARAARRLGRPARVQLKIDALLGRQGVLPDRAEALADALERHPEIRVEAAYAHFANIEDTTDPVHAQAQVQEFERAVAVLEGRGLRGLERHIASTSGVMVYERAARRSDWIRLGIGLYGLYPSEPLARSFSGLELRPAMRWTARLAQVKELPEGHPVGYGLTYIASRPTRVGIVPQGYSDGYDRGLSNAADVLAGGRRCPVVGRVAMNMFMVDLAAVPEAGPEDEVVLIGEQGGARVSAEEVARRIGTINYEVVARVSPLLPRRLVP